MFPPVNALQTAPNLSLHSEARHDSVVNVHKLCNEVSLSLGIQFIQDTVKPELFLTLGE